MTQTYEIAIAFPRWYDFSTRVIQGIEEYINEHSQFQALDFGFIDPRELPQRLRGNSVRGLLTCMPGSGYREIAADLPADLPVVSMMDELEEFDVISINEDHQAVARLMLEHFAQAGFNRIAYLGCGDCFGASRLETALQRQLEKTRRDLPVFTYHFPDVAESQSPAEDHEPLRRWLNELPKPVGIACYGPAGAQLLANACHELGWGVPGEVGIVSRANDRRCLLSHPSITSLDHPFEQYGREMMRALAARLKGRSYDPPPPLQPTGLIVRHSTGTIDEDQLAVTRAMRYIKDNACRGITVEQLIDQTQFISRSKFFMLFTRLTGQTPHQAIHRVRIEQACQYLTQSQMSIGRISELCGFKEQRHFTTAFGKQMGMPPSIYRKNRRNHEAQVTQPETQVQKDRENTKQSTPD